MRDRGVNNSELARRLGLHERVIRRMLDPGVGWVRPAISTLDSGQVEG
jgi:DNA-binding transcriptional regulator LsrR (DeoR family)